MADSTRKKFDIRIEGNTAVWELQLDGDIQGTYRGTFRFRCFLTPIQQIAANREYREILGNSAYVAPEHETSLAFALTQLKYRIVEAPPFWASTKQSVGFEGDVPDENIINEVLEASIEAELKFRKQIREKRDENLKKAIKAAEALLNQKDDNVETKDDEDDTE